MQKDDNMLFLMKSSPIISEVITRITKLANEINRLDKLPFDTGMGDLLYPSEINTIEAVGKNPGITPTELCSLFGVTKGAVSQMVGKLSRKGYIKKEKSEESGREVLLNLSAKGQLVFKRHEEFHRRMDQELGKYLESVSDKKINEFVEMIDLINAHIIKYIELRNKKI